MTDDLKNLPLMLSVEQVLPHLQVKRSALYQAIESGQVPSIRLGRKIRIPRAWLEHVAGLDQRATGPPESEKPPSDQAALREISNERSP